MQLKEFSRYLTCGRIGYSIQRRAKLRFLQLLLNKRALTGLAPLGASVTHKQGKTVNVFYLLHKVFCLLIAMSLWSKASFEFSAEKSG